METGQVEAGALSVVAGGAPVAEVQWRGGTAPPAGSPTRSFALASAAKPMSAFLVARLVAEGLLTWDEPLQDLLPDLSLWERPGVEVTSMRDLVCHRTGLPRHDGVAFGATGLRRADLVQLLPHLEASAAPRTRFQYSNLMYAVAGHVCERLSGRPWEELLREYVLQPTGMTSTTVEDDLLAPAGGIRTTAADLVRWMRLNTTPDSDLAVLATSLHRPEIDVQPVGLLPEATTGYGRGWFTGSYRGHRLVHHGGAVPGATTLVALLPDRQLAVSALLEGGVAGACELSVYSVLDLLLDLPPVDWGQRLTDVVQPPHERITASAAQVLDPQWDGCYRHPAYGEVVVSAPTLLWRELRLCLVTTTAGGSAVLAPDGALREVELGQGELRLPLEPAVSPIRFRRTA